jgi:hypothetical protein
MGRERSATRRVEVQAWSRARWIGRGRSLVVAADEWPSLRRQGLADAEATMARADEPRVTFRCSVGEREAIDRAARVAGVATGRWLGSAR